MASQSKQQKAFFGQLGLLFAFPAGFELALGQAALTANSHTASSVLQVA